MAKRSIPARRVLIAAAWTAAEAKSLNALIDLFKAHTPGLALTYTPSSVPVSDTQLLWDIHLNIPAGVAGWSKRDIEYVKKWAAGFWHGLRARAAVS